MEVLKDSMVLAILGQFTQTHQLHSEAQNVQCSLAWRENYCPSLSQDFRAHVQARIKNT